MENGNLWRTEITALHLQLVFLITPYHMKILSQVWRVCEYLLIHFTIGGGCHNSHDFFLFMMIEKKGWDLIIVLGLARLDKKIQPSAFSQEKVGTELHNWFMNIFTSYLFSGSQCNNYKVICAQFVKEVKKKILLKEEILPIIQPTPNILRGQYLCWQISAKQVSHTISLLLYQNIFNQ